MAHSSWAEYSRIKAEQNKASPFMPMCCTIENVQHILITIPLYASQDTPLPQSIS